MEPRVKSNGNDSMSIAAAGVVLVGLLIWGGWALFNNIFGEKKDDQATTQQVETTSYDNPIKLNVSDFDGLTGQEFVDKYKGKWVAFDGELIGTSQIAGAPSLSTSISTTSGFADGSMFKITATGYTFDSTLSRYSDITEGYEKPVAVHVVARVEKYDTDRLWVLLDPNISTDSSAPSVKSR